MRALSAGVLAIVLASASVSAICSALPLITSVRHPAQPAEQLPPPQQLQPKTAQPPQPAPRDPRAAASGTGSIRGTVAAGDTGEPLRRARLALSAPELQKPRVAMTDGQGRYEFRDLPAARFVLSASKTGYATMQFGQRRAFEPGRLVELAEKQLLEGVDLALPRGAVITGRVIDELGEPVVAACVAAMRLRFQAGARQPVAVGRAVETDDLGEYRLFDLAAGSYYVGVSSALFGETLTFGPAFYPGTSSAAEAQTVAVKPGQIRSGIDVFLSPARLVQLAGVVIDARGSPLRDATVRAISVPSTGSYSGVVRPDGTFTIAGLPQGEYLLSASGQSTETAQSEHGMLSVSAIGGDVTGLVVTATPGSRVSGRIMFERSARPPLATANIILVAESVDGRVSAGARVGTLRGDWTFELTGQFGARLIRVAGLPGQWTLQAVLVGNRDITDTPLEITGGADIDGLRVVLTSRLTNVSGTVTDKDDKQVKDYSIVIFAEDATRWTGRSRFVATARPDLSGRFEIAGLPPAAYLIAALNYIEEGTWEDPEFLEWLRARATKLALVEDEKRSVELTLVRIEAA